MVSDVCGTSINSAKSNQKSKVEYKKLIFSHSYLHASHYIQHINIFMCAYMCKLFMVIQSCLFKALNKQANLAW